MAEKKPPLHEVAMEKLVATCAELHDSHEQGRATIAETEKLLTRGMTSAEILRDGHVPRRDHPKIVPQLAICVTQIASWPKLCLLIAQLQLEFLQTKACPECGTGLEEDGSCRNCMHGLDPSVRAAVEA